MRTASELYVAAIASLEEYVDEEQDDTRLGEAVVKIGDYTLAMQEDGVDDIGQRNNRLASLECDLQAIIDTASPGAAGSAAIARMTALVDDITAALQQQESP
jgi:hypothetical protein